jgi:hypothetical protein
MTSTRSYSRRACKSVQRSGIAARRSVNRSLAIARPSLRRERLEMELSGSPQNFLAAAEARRPSWTKSPWPRCSHGRHHLHPRWRQLMHRLGTPTKRHRRRPSKSGWKTGARTDRGSEAVMPSKSAKQHRFMEAVSFETETDRNGKASAVNLKVR